MKTHLFIALLSLLFILPACSDNDEPKPSTEPLLNKEDSLAMVEIFRDLKMDINPEFSYADRRTWPCVQYHLDEATNEYRIFAFVYGTDMLSDITGNLNDIDNRLVYRVKHLAPGAKLSPAFGRLTLLQGLTINVRNSTSDRLDCPIPSELFDCPLWTVFINGIGAGGDGHPFPPGIGKLKPTIREMNLNSNKFTGGIPSDLENLSGSRLQFLFMSDCGFSGELPAWIGSVSYMTWLADNNLTSIDWDIFKGPKVVTLPLIMNNLMGGVEVPEWVLETERWNNAFAIENRYQRNGVLIAPYPPDLTLD